MSTTTPLRRLARAGAAPVCVLILGSAGCFDPSASFGEDLDATDTDAVGNDPAAPTASESGPEDPSAGQTSTIPDGETTDGPDPSGETGEPPDGGCGDGVLDAGEACDSDTFIGGETCADVGLGKASELLRCTDTCTLDFGACSACGDGMVTSPEECEDGIVDATCQSLGFGGGTLGCNACAFDTSNCWACGDGIQDPSEACDGNDLNGFDCEDLGFVGGQLHCTNACTFDVSACDGPGCGDGIVQAGESCDGSVNGQTCASLTGLPDGVVTCSPTCTFDTSDCSAPADVRRVFITAQAFAANFGSAFAADDVCQSVASAAGLGGTFMAWLSDSNTTPSQRFDHSSVPYALLDGTVIADDWNDLVDGQLYSAIDTTESVQPVDPDTTTVATATASNGTLNVFNGHCNNWTSASSMYSTTVGNEENVFSWSESGAVGCNTPVKLYCFEQ